MDIQYSIVRSSKRAKLTITVERDCSIVVHAPENTPEETINKIVNSKRQWLFDKLRHPQKYQEAPHAPGKEVVNGESALYLGRNYRIELQETKSGMVEFSRRFLVPPAHKEKRREVLREWYLSSAKNKILPRVTHYAHQLGVEFAEAKIVDTRYRWGSCTINDNVNFNWRLIKAPMLVIDYVVIHELAHLIEGNHTPRFWNIVRANNPNMEKAKTWLMEHGQILEDEI